MQLRIVFRPQAEGETLAVCEWYESRRTGLGREFAEAVDALVDRIAASPRVFPRVHGEIRRAVLSRFPYAVYFRLDHETLVLLAVHGRQDPARWQSRS